MAGWIGTILRVNLTEGTVKKEALNMDAAKDFLGIINNSSYFILFLWSSLPHSRYR